MKRQSAFCDAKYSLDKLLTTYLTQSEMETPNTDNVSSKERHGVVSYSINGILGLTSEPASVKDRSSKNTKEAEEVEGNYKRFSDDCLLEQLHTY